VDFGAGDYVYVALRPGETARLLAAPGTWRIDVGGQPYATGRAPVSEGWAHVMDATRGEQPWPSPASAEAPPGTRSWFSQTESW